MTKDTVQLLAKYNATANKELNSILSTLMTEEWKRDFGGFFGSIHALCSHLFLGDFSWLNRFKTLRPFPALNAPLLDKQYGRDVKPFDRIDQYIELRRELDGVLLRFADDLTNAVLTLKLKYMNWKGEPQERNFGGLILHVFNHQTHHRGMVSLYLDMLGKANDFSNLLTLV